MSGEELKSSDLYLILSLLRNWFFLLAKKVKEMYSVDLDYNREENSEDPPLFHALRNYNNKRIVDWLVKDCG